jgi:hypothetical protein
LDDLFLHDAEPDPQPQVDLTIDQPKKFKEDEETAIKKRNQILDKSVLKKKVKFQEQVEEPIHEGYHPEIDDEEDVKASSPPVAIN